MRGGIWRVTEGDGPCQDLSRIVQGGLGVIFHMGRHHDTI